MTYKKLLVVVFVAMVAACQAKQPDTEMAAPPVSEKTSSGDLSSSRSQQKTAGAAEIIAPSSTSTMASLARLANVECAAGDGSQAICTAGRLSVDLYDSCGREGFFGAISTGNGVTLKEKPEADAGTVARLGSGQFLCIRGLARQEQNPEWYFVMAIPVETVAGCAGKELCKIYGDRPVAWTVPSNRNPCALVNEQYVGDCASGWVVAESIEAFSEGI